MKVGVIGSGYVGLVAGACFADSGNDVICADVDESKIAKLKNGEIPIYEPGLDVLVRKNVKADRLTFTTDVASAIKNSEVIFIAVGTPEGEDGSADLKYVLSVANTIGKNLNDYKVVVNKSTVPVGTAELVRNEIKSQTSVEFDVVSNPEFLKEGTAIDDFMRPDRVVIGASSKKAADIMGELYSPYVRTGKPILFMSNKSAEVTKYAANALLATKVTFMNEIANLCEAVDADVAEVRKGVGTDARIGSSFLFPGVGYGGSCFPKDTRALLKTAQKHGVVNEIVAAVDRVNDNQKKRLVEKVSNHFGGNLQGKKFAVWGISFKPETDDIREAPSLVVINDLIDAGAEVVAYDPEAISNAQRVLEGKKGVSFSKSSYEALDGADALLIVTEWNEFRRPDFQKIKSLLNAPLVFDGRNLFKPELMAEKGFTYYSIGRAVTSGAAEETSFQEAAN